MIGVIIAVVIFILLLFTSIELNFTRTNTTKVILHVFFFYFKLPNKNDKGLDFRKILSSAMPIYKGASYLLSKSSLAIEEITYISIFDLTEKPFLSITKFISTSVTLGLASERVKKFAYRAKRYIITEQKEQVTNISISVKFILLHLIIFLFLVAYYKVDNTIRRGYENV